MSVRDTGWVDGERRIGDFSLCAVQYEGHVRVRVYADTFDGLVQVVPTLTRADLDTGQRAAEDALRKLCRDTLAALGAAP